MKILSASQIKSLDNITIVKEPIKSIDLMDWIVMICTRRLMKLILNSTTLNRTNP